MVDLTNVTPLTLAELRIRREQQKHARRHGPPTGPPRSNKIRKSRKGNKVIVASVSLLPELKIRAERDLGGGNFSKAVRLSIIAALDAYDADKDRDKRPIRRARLAHRYTDPKDRPEETEE